MSFSMNETKIEELVKASDKPPYEISSSDLPLPPQPRIENYSGGPYYVASGATYAPPVLVTEDTRGQFAVLRRQIEESGAPLYSEKELTREMDAMRGRR